jgi:hypothetical protein
VVHVTADELKQTPPISLSDLSAAIARRLAAEKSSAAETPRAA